MRAGGAQIRQAAQAAQRRGHCPRQQVVAQVPASCAGGADEKRVRHRASVASEPCQFWFWATSRLEGVMVIGQGRRRRL